MTTVSMLLGNVTSGYPVKNSLRLRSSASAYLNRTPSVASNRQKWTWSGWVKRGTLGASAGSVLFSAYNGAANQDLYICFGSTTGTGGPADTFSFFSPPTGTNVNVLSNALYRDPSAWYHCIVAIDTTQATASNRVRMYINGAEISYASSTYPSLNQSLQINSTQLHTIGVNAGVSAWGFFDGEIAEVNFIDGQQLTPSSFGTYDINGVWQPIKYSGSYGTNGFYLPFSNTTSTTTLGYDSSGNGNNWTTNNISLTAGSTYDSMTDSPTVSSASVANYAVLNPILPVSVSGYAITNGNMTFTSSSVTSAGTTMNLPTSGKWYWEATLSAGTAANLGVYDTTYQLVAGSNPGTTAYGYGYVNSTGQKLNNNTYTSYGATYTTNDVIGVAFDSGAGTLTFYKNGTSQGTAFTGLTGKVYSPFFAVNLSTWDANFGQRPFSYTPPTGFNALNTYNLPAATIKNGALYMAATTYTGTGSSNSISNGNNNTIGTTFQPDLVWIKSRSAATDHKLTDSVRGTTKALVSDSTAAETTDSNGLTAFNSGGFTVGSDTNYNNNAATYVGWNWKAGGSGGSSNTNGSITSTVSANQTAGFSIATFTTQSSGTGTVGHGLGVTPDMIIIKLRATVNNWRSYHSVLGNTQYMILNSTSAATTDSATWNNTSPTSSVFTLGSYWAGSLTGVAYCFAAVSGYSAFGSYTGNGSTDGPFIYCGFRPRWVLIKNASSTANWFIDDTSRDLYNVTQNRLFPSVSNAETTSPVEYDILSNGFKIRIDSDVGTNTNGNTYIYAAFAENPFNYSRAR